MRPSPVAEITANVILRLLQTAARVGAEPADILMRAHVPYSMADLEGMTDRSGGMGTLPRHHGIAIYRESIVTIGWHSSRLDHKPQMHPDEFRLMCYCVISCRSFRDVIERQAMFFRTRGDRISVMELTEAGPVAIVTVDTLRRRKSFSAFLTDLAGMSIFTRFYAWLLGIAPQEFHVQLMHSSAFANEAMADFFAGDLVFDGPVNSISFSQSLLAMPIVRTPEELDNLLLEFPFEYIAAPPVGMPLRDRIRSIYNMSLARFAPFPTTTELSNLVGQSISTIRRRLAEDGSSIRTLKDIARHDAAIYLLRDGRRTIDDIALSIGFRDIHSFRQAFLRWKGMTPSHYRDIIKQSHANGGETRED